MASDCGESNVDSLSEQAVLLPDHRLQKASPRTFGRESRQQAATCSTQRTHTVHRVFALAASSGLVLCIGTAAVLRSSIPVDGMQHTKLPAEKENKFEPWSLQHIVNITMTNKTAADIVGVAGNNGRDLSAFQASLSLYTTLSLLILIASSALRQTFPALYTSGAGVEAGLSPGSLTLLGWLRPSISLSKVEDLEKCIGLDHFLILQFSKLCIKLFSCIGAAMLLIMCPLHYFCAKKDADFLSRFGIGALEERSKVYWVHALLVWGVAVFAQTEIYNSQQEFVRRRHAWLRGMSMPRLSSVLVCKIPEAYRCDAQFKEYFEDRIFSREQIQAISVVKNTSRLRKARQELELAVKHQRHSSRHLEEGCCPALVRRILEIGHPPMMSLDTLKAHVQDEQERIGKAATTPGGINSTNGFVTFKSARDALILTHLQLTENQDEWELDLPPGTGDVNWEHLSADTGPRRKALSTFVGRMFIVLLFLFFGPVVTFISGIGAVASKLLMYAPFEGLSRVVIGGLLPSLGLNLFTSFLPTILMLILRTFFTVPSEAELQYKLWQSYILFQFLFVLLAPAIGTSLLITLEEVLDRPIMSFILLAKTLPSCSHFYLNYILLHWSSQCLNLLRYWPLLKFLWHLRGYSVDDARQFSEPEDQEYYGIGSRSARSTTIALIGLLYCQVDPIISAVALVYFALHRLIYGYLLVFAETRKGDLGGAIWVDKLRVLQCGLMMYVLMMTGVLSVNAGSTQATIAGSSLFYLLVSHRKFGSIAWKKLPFEHMPKEISNGDRDHTGDCYEQPELRKY